ncbi:hypothetical protein G3M83_13280 [Rouxiella badensis]|uniref:hypothetical protein n=1 Tax=Rouxiella badensis TaxID=1646377 RepID=UPI0013EF045A|nr:hypothetical protein [Rouxiella badensis]QII38573.1 hypothetical protein G3M83_13280 [Rouxiella badensis]
MKKLTLFGICTTLLVGLGASSVSQAYPYHHGGYRGGWGGPRVVVGVGPYWGPDPYYWGPPPYYGPPPVVYVTPPAPQVYVQKPASASYYCHNPVGYYPQIPRCPTGWQKLAPR